MNLSKGFENASSGTGPTDPHSWMENVADFKDDPAKPNIIIVIDDVKTHTLQKVLNAVGDNQITMAFLPDHSKQSDIDQARSHGHDAIIHMPMEPLNAEERGIKLEPSAIRTAYEPIEIGFVLKSALERFDGVIGINNHQGSGAMQDEKVLDRVMSEMNRRGLLFLDSKTISASKYGKENAEMAQNKAEEHDADFVKRNVFIDHENPPKDVVIGQLSKIEAIAQKEESVIAIGHTHKDTLDALKEWMPKVADKFDFIPLGAHAAAELGLIGGKNELTNEATPAPGLQ